LSAVVFAVHILLIVDGKSHGYGVHIKITLDEEARKSVQEVLASHVLALDETHKEHIFIIYKSKNSN